MTFSTSNLPKNYIPYETTTVCSNNLLGGVQILEISDVLPLIIGKGDEPQIWVQGVADHTKPTFISLVENSISKHHEVEVKKTDGNIVVSVSNKEILSVRAESSDHVVIDFVDLRPVGLNLFGDASTLNVAGNQFSGNTMSGSPATALIGMG